MRKSLLARLIAHINDAAVHLSGSLTANRALQTSAAGAIEASSTVSSTELGYLDGVTSAVQTQLDGKAASSHTHSAADVTSGTLDIARGGTGASLSDPNADRVLFWDDSAGQVTFLTVGAGLTITGTTISTTGGSGGSTIVNYLTGDGSGDFTTTSTTFVDLTGATITDSNATAGDLQCLFNVGNYNGNNQNNKMKFVLDSTTDSMIIKPQTNPVNTIRYDPMMTVYDNVSAASHTVKVQVLVGSGTGTWVNSSTTDAWMMTLVRHT